MMMGPTYAMAPACDGLYSGNIINKTILNIHKTLNMTSHDMTSHDMIFSNTAPKIV